MTILACPDMILNLKTNERRISEARKSTVVIFHGSCEVNTIYKSGSSKKISVDPQYRKPFQK